MTALNVSADLRRSAAFSVLATSMLPALRGAENDPIEIAWYGCDWAFPVFRD